MVRVMVTDSSDRPVYGAEVIVKWQGGGVSVRRTDRNGVADTGVSSGTAEYVQVEGHKVLGTVWLDGLIQVPNR